MKARMVLGSALSLLLVAGVGYSQTQVTGGMRQGMMRSDSTVGMMRGGMSKGMMMGPGGQMGMMSGMRGKMMGMMGSGMGMMGGMMMEPLHSYLRALAHSSGWMAKLDLSDQQKTKLVTLRADFLKRKADLQAELQKAKIDLDLLLGKNAPPAKVKQLLEKYYSSKVALQVDAYKTAQQIRSLLTPQQRKVFDASLKAGPCPNCGGRQAASKGMSSIR